MITVCPFDEKHVTDLAAMMVEMTRFYGAAISMDMNIEANIREQSKNMDMLLAFHEDSLAGFSTFKTLFPVGGLLSFTHIQQIYVGSSSRRFGVARHLMIEIAKTAQNRGCQWIEWATAAENKVARTFYDGLGASNSPKVHYILKGEALKKLASD